MNFLGLKGFQVVRTEVYSGDSTKSDDFESRMQYTYYDLWGKPIGISVVDVCCNPTDPWAWVGLAGDCIDLIPFVTGVGEGIKCLKVVIKIANKTADVADAVNDGKKVVKAADKVSDSVKQLDNVSDAAKKSDNVNVYMTGKDGEDELEKLFGGQPQDYFKTTNGDRYVDQLADGIAHESKVGYTSLSKRVKTQITKDAELINSGQIDGAHWHFFTSGVTGKGGASGPLLDYLTENGIAYTIH